MLDHNVLHLVAGPINRRFGAYEQSEAANQRPNQKVSVFKAYLEELEAHWPLLNEDVRANMACPRALQETGLEKQVLSEHCLPPSIKWAD